MTCQACGGLIGRDCFNPEECMAITRDMADRYRDQEHRIHQLESEIEYLKSRLAETEDQAGRAVDEAKYDAAAESEAALQAGIRSRKDGWG